MTIRVDVDLEEILEEVSEDELLERFETEEITNHLKRRFKDYGHEACLETIADTINNISDPNTIKSIAFYLKEDVAKLLMQGIKFYYGDHDEKR
ncbi:hypothetical protein [Campylobacter sp. RM16192]|uniref:hypothetical protein n=1 Tax=Campylobacter sp. RM16192 TaxID=1660080 RepID=UPI0014518472|nr:hypothetical protein [Campylobacter sp. RM16192]QCD52483.1 hypothetical protein CDOMC_0860 [Campylobacter sp. RM16192]